MMHGYIYSRFTKSLLLRLGICHGGVSMKASSFAGLTRTWFKVSMNCEKGYCPIANDLDSMNSKEITGNQECPSIVFCKYVLRIQSLAIMSERRLHE
jgi:hypothetical protein